MIQPVTTQAQNERNRTTLQDSGCGLTPMFSCGARNSCERSEHSIMLRRLQHTLGFRRFKLDHVGESQPLDRRGLQDRKIRVFRGASAPQAIKVD